MQMTYGLEPVKNPNTGGNTDMWGAVIGAAVSLYAANKASKDAKSYAASQSAQQRDFAQNSIAWRTEDAKRAGIHPLYALSGSAGQSYTPVPYVDQMAPALAQAGQKVGAAYAQHKQKDIQRASTTAQLAVMNSTARLNNAQAAQLEGQDPESIATGAGTNVITTPDRVPENIVEVKPQEAIPSAATTKAVTPYSNPFWDRHTVFTNPLTGNDWYIFTPRADNPAEGLEGLGATAATLMGTLAYYLGVSAKSVYKDWTVLQKKYPTVFKQVINLVDRYYSGKTDVPGIRPLYDGKKQPRVRGMNQLDMENY